MSVRVAAGARLHFGFLNLSLAHGRLYGSLGVALDEPTVVVEARPADEVVVSDGDHQLVEQVVDLLDVPGAAVEVVESFPSHVGLGSGTQRGLAIIAAVGEAYGIEANVRDRAPAIGRGGRSGVGVATFESGGFVMDDGHPTDRFTTEPPAPGDWTVPHTVVQRPIPAHWRFLLVLPDVDQGRHGEDEETSMRATVDKADPALSDRIAGLVVRRVLPAVSSGNVSAFGSAIAELGRLNGRWYADEQGGVYRPPVGRLVDVLSSEPAIEGAGQSSWGPTVYGITDEEHADEARRAGAAALDATGLDGTVHVVSGRNAGARIDH